jgi:hypothetical protein
MTRRGLMSEIASMIFSAIFHVSINFIITIGSTVVYADDLAKHGPFVAYDHQDSEISPKRIAGPRREQACSTMKPQAQRIGVMTTCLGREDNRVRSLLKRRQLLNSGG